MLNIFLGLSKNIDFKNKLFWHLVCESLGRNYYLCFGELEVRTTFYGKCNPWNWLTSKAP